MVFGQKWEVDRVQSKVPLTVAFPLQFLRNTKVNFEKTQYHHVCISTILRYAMSCHVSMLASNEW